MFVAALHLVKEFSFRCCVTSWKGKPVLLQCRPKLGQLQNFTLPRTLHSAPHTNFDSFIKLTAQKYFFDRYIFVHKISSHMHAILDRIEQKPYQQWNSV